MFRRKIRYLFTLSTKPFFCFWSLVEDQTAYKAGYPAPIYGIQPDIEKGRISVILFLGDVVFSCLL